MKRTIIHIGKETLKLFKVGKELNINGVKHKLTKAEKLVYIAYLSKVCKFGSEEVGTTIAISNSEIANMCGLDVTTVINARKSLEELALVTVNKLDRFKHQIYIVGYENLHATKDEGGTGYVKIGFNMFHELCKLNSNELRLACDLIVAIDNNKGSKFNKSNFITRYFSNIRKYLPSYINCKKKVRSILKKLDGIFDLTIQDDSVDAKEIFAYNTDNYLATVSKNNRKGIKKLAKNAGIKYSTKDLTDLVQMSIEYSYAAISNAFMYILTRGITDIDNLGGLVRSLIKGSFRVELY